MLALIPPWRLISAGSSSLLACRCRAAPATGQDNPLETFCGPGTTHARKRANVGHPPAGGDDSAANRLLSIRSVGNVLPVGNNLLMPLFNDHLSILSRIAARRHPAVVCHGGPIGSDDHQPRTLQINYMHARTYPCEQSIGRHKEFTETFRGRSVLSRVFPPVSQEMHAIPVTVTDIAVCGRSIPYRYQSRASVSACSMRSTPGRNQP